MLENLILLGSALPRSSQVQTLGPLTGGGLRDSCLLGSGQSGFEMHEYAPDYLRGRYPEVA